MKPIVNFFVCVSLLFSVFGLGMLLLTGCKNDNRYHVEEMTVMNVDSRNITGNMKELSYSGHKYLIVERSSTTSIIHAEHCQCKEK